MTLLFPKFLPHNEANKYLAHFKLVSNSLLGELAAGVNRSYLPNLIPIKSPATAVFFRRRVPIPSLCDFVASIILGCAQKKVVRVYTRRIVAFVANTKPLRYIAFSEAIRNPVGFVNFSSKSKKPISLVVPSASPLPASGVMPTLGHFVPKIYELLRSKYWIYRRSCCAILVFSGGHNAVMPIVRAFESLIRLLRPTKLCQ